MDRPNMIGIWCRTEEEVFTLLSRLDSLGYRWSTGDSLLGLSYYDGNPIIYHITGDRITKCNCNVSGYDIVDLRDFLRTYPHLTPDEFYSAVTVNGGEAWCQPVI